MSRVCRVRTADRLCDGRPAVSLRTHACVSMLSFVLQDNYGEHANKDMPTQAYASVGLGTQFHGGKPWIVDTFNFCRLFALALYASLSHGFLGGKVYFAIFSS